MHWNARTAKGFIHRDIKPANIFVTQARSRKDTRLSALAKLAPQRQMAAG